MKMRTRRRGHEAIPSPYGHPPPSPVRSQKNCDFESWLNRIEFHFEVTKCPVEEKTGSLLLLLDVECFEVGKQFGLKSTTNFD